MRKKEKYMTKKGKRRQKEMKKHFYLIILSYKIKIKTPHESLNLTGYYKTWLFEDKDYFQCEILAYSKINIFFFGRSQDRTHINKWFSVRNEMSPTHQSSPVTISINLLFLLISLFLLHYSQSLMLYYHDPAHVPPHQCLLVQLLAPKKMDWLSLKRKQQKKEKDLLNWSLSLWANHQNQDSITGLSSAHSNSIKYKSSTQ